MASNPFNFTGPADGATFCGRRRQVQEIADDLGSWNGPSHAIIGGLHMGKSSLLRAIEAELRARLAANRIDPCVVPVPISLRSIAGVASEEDVFGFFRLRVVQSLSGPSAPPVVKADPAVQDRLRPFAQEGRTPATLFDFESGLSEVVTTLEPLFGPTRIALLVESIETVAEVAWVDQLFDHLNALVHDGDLRNNVRIVLTGAERLLTIKQKGSPLLTRLRLYYLEPLLQDDIQTLLALAPGLSPEVHPEVMAQAGGHPFVLQHLLYYLVESDREATPDMVAAEVQRFVNDRTPDLEHWWSSIGEDGWRVYCFLQRAGDWTPRSKIIRAIGAGADAGLKRLLYHGLVRHDGAHRQYRAYGHLFGDWCAERCTALLPQTEVLEATAPPVSGGKGVRPQSPPPMHPAGAIAAPGRLNRKLLPHQYEDLQSALLSAYPTRSALEQMLLLRLGERLEWIAGQGNLKKVALEVIEWAAEQGRLDELILEASQHNPGNPDLQAFMQAYMLAFAAAFPPTPGGKLEAEVLKTVRFANVADWRALMARREQAVCRIEGPEEFGTGFLVARNVVLTCYHVVDDVHADPTRRDKVVIRFDYKTDENGVKTQEGRVCHLADDWLVAHSPIAQLDFAALRLAEDAGEEEVTGSPGSRRGWITPQASRFEIGAPLLILQHPKATPLKIAAGSVSGEQRAPKRVIYTANTLAGSSGAPCFTHNWELVALHQAGDEATGNLGIPCSEILPQLPAEARM